jgi:protein-disulfide isomerase
MSEPTITIRIRRVHIWGILGLLAGLGAGFLIGHATADKKPQAILYGVPPAAGTNASAAAGAQSVPPKGPVKVATEGRPAKGPVNAKATLVEFVDYQCPFCGQFERETMPLIQKNYGDKVRIVSRQFPLSIHQHAMEAAIAMECAYKQDKFWPLHDSLFRNQDALDATGLIRLARSADLDIAKLRSCQKSAAVKQTIQKDLSDGRAYGVTGTPTVFVNGKALSGALPYEQYKTALDAALKG